MLPILAIRANKSSMCLQCSNRSLPLFLHFVTRILRIIALIPIFALVFFLAGSVPSSAVYILAWADAYESVALTSYFLLLITYVVPNPQQQDGYFDRLQHPENCEGSLTWYHVSSVAFLRLCLMAADRTLISGSGSPCSSTSPSQSSSPSQQTLHKLPGHTV